MDYAAFLVSSVSENGTLTRKYLLGGDEVTLRSILPGMVLPTHRISLECTCHSQDYDKWSIVDLDTEEVISEYLSYEEAKTFYGDVNDIRAAEYAYRQEAAKEDGGSTEYAD